MIATTWQHHPLIRMLRALDLPASDFVVFGSGPMLAHGLRADVGDLDVVARGAAWDALTAVRPPQPAASGVGETVRLQIEVFNRWPGYSASHLIDSAQHHGGIPFAPLAEVRRSKLVTRRPKDWRDLALLSA